MAEHEFDPQLSLDTLSDLISERSRGSSKTDLRFALLQRMAKGSDLKGSLVELHLQQSPLYREAMVALQQVVGNAGVERLHQQLTALAGLLEPERAKGATNDVPVDPNALRQDALEGPNSNGQEAQEQTEAGGLEASVLQRIRTSTGLEVEGIHSSADPKLAEQGKAGVATGPREVRVAPDRADDEHLLLHEVAHAIQLTPVGERKQEEAERGKDEGAKSLALEAEADAFANAVQAGQPFSIRGVGNGPLYQDDEELGESKVEPIKEIIATDSGKGTKRSCLWELGWERIQTSPRSRSMGRSST